MTPFSDSDNDAGVLVTDIQDPTASSFQAIIASFGLNTQCEMTIAQSQPCPRPAEWRIDLHGCERALLCGQHLRAWERDAAKTSTGRCAHCGRQFTLISDSYIVTAL